MSEEMTRMMSSLPFLLAILTGRAWCGTVYLLHPSRIPTTTSSASTDPILAPRRHLNEKARRF